MIVVDSSIWIRHFRTPTLELAALLREDRVLMHPYVLGEVALGNLPARANTLRLLGDLPAPPVVLPNAIMDLIERERLSGLGIGLIDVNLVASARLIPECKIWTTDRRLDAVADRFGVVHRRRLV